MLSLKSAAAAFGHTKETIRRGLVAAGQKVEPGKTYSIKQIHLALAGDTKFERARLLRAQAVAKERENKVAENKWVDADEFTQKFISETVKPFKMAIYNFARQKGLEPEIKKIWQECFGDTSQKAEAKPARMNPPAPIIKKNEN